MRPRIIDNALWLRVSVHAYNELVDVERLAETVTSDLREGA
jgi:selenocysteine lyase/cysteine desulfurase